MWNDLNMHDRHKFIRLAVTNGVYDLDTIRSLYDKQENKYGTGGEIEVSNLPTDPNRKPIDVQPIIDRIRAERLAKYTIPESPMEQIKNFTDKLQEERFNREYVEQLFPTRDTDNYIDIKRLLPVIDSKFSFIRI